ncbi:hypothetical protein OKW30_005958 [Paraburkholderia sp. Clong3]
MPTGLRAAPSKDNPFYDIHIIYEFVVIINPVDDRTVEFSGLRRYAAAWENCLGKLSGGVAKVSLSQETTRTVENPLLCRRAVLPSSTRRAARFRPELVRLEPAALVDFRPIPGRRQLVGLINDDQIPPADRITARNDAMPREIAGHRKAGCYQSIERQYHSAVDISVPQVGQDRVDVVEPLALDMGSDLAFRGEV